MNIECCKDCMKRKVGCHSICDKYIERRKALDEYNATVRKQKELENAFAASSIRSIAKIARDKRRLYNQGRPVNRGI